MEAYTIIHLTLGLLTHSLIDSLICPHNALVSLLKLVPWFQACFIAFKICVQLGVILSSGLLFQVSYFNGFNKNKNRGAFQEQR